MTYLNSESKISVSNQNSQLGKIVPSPQIEPPSPKEIFRRTNGSGLKVKIALAAIALSVIPTLALGLVIYRTAANRIVRQNNQMQVERTQHLGQTLEKYINNRVNEAQVIAKNPIFTNPNIMDLVTTNQKKAALDSFQSQTGVYDSIVYLDLKGNPLFQSKSELPLRRNYGKRDYFQKAISTKYPVMNTVGVSDLTGRPRLEFAVPVIDAWTDDVLGVLRFRIPNQYIQPILADYALENEQWHVINTKGLLTLSSLPDLANQPLANYYPQIQQARIEKVTELVETKNPANPQAKQIVTYAPVYVGAINPDLNLGVAISVDTDIAYAPLKFLMPIVVAGTLCTAVLSGLIASWLANRLTRTIAQLTNTVDRLGAGQLEARVLVKHSDELGILGDRLNLMAEKLETSFQRQKTLVQTAELMSQMSQATNNRELQLPFSLFLQEIRNLIKADRLVFYQFDEKWQGIVTAESVDREYARTLGVQFKDPCFAKEYVRKYQRGRIQAVSDIYRANLTECHLQQLKPYGVQASLVVPVIINATTDTKAERLIGLLIAHQCGSTRIWSQSNIDYLQQVSYQLAEILRGFVSQKQKGKQQAWLEQDLAQIVLTSEAIAQGNLNQDYLRSTNPNSKIVPAFSKAIANLKQTIVQIKTPTAQIKRELSSSKQDALTAKEQLRQQANELSLMFAFVEQAALSTMEIAKKTSLAADTVDGVLTEVQGEKTNFNNAIAFISQLEDALQDNQETVKELSNASEKMTRVVAVIRKINLRASLMANKLQQRLPDAIGDSSLKEEVESIQQSIAATKELENVIRDIDHEVGRVLKNYESREKQLQRENNLVSDASSNLANIAEATKAVQQNLLSLVNMTQNQVQTTHKIAELKDCLDRSHKQLETHSDRSFAAIEQASLTAKDLANVSNFFRLEPK